MPANLHHLADRLHRPARRPEGARACALADPTMLTAPFCYLAGHKLVEFNPDERRNFERYVRNGGFVFVDDCNHDIDGLFARSFEAQMATIFGADALKKLPNDHALYRSFFTFDGPPATGFELNGWGDDLVHDYLQGHRDRRPPRRALQQQGLRLRVGLRLAQQALPGRGQHEVRGQHRDVCADAELSRMSSDLVATASDERRTVAPTKPDDRTTDSSSAAGATLRDAIAQADRRPGRRGRAAADRPARRRPLPARRRAGPRQDAAGAHARAGAGAASSAACSSRPT